MIVESIGAQSLFRLLPRCETQMFRFLNSLAHLFHLCNGRLPLPWCFEQVDVRFNHSLLLSRLESLVIDCPIHLYYWTFYYCMFHPSPSPNLTFDILLHTTCSLFGRFFLRRIRHFRDLVGHCESITFSVLKCRIWIKCLTRWSYATTFRHYLLQLHSTTNKYFIPMISNHVQLRFTFAS